MPSARRNGILVPIFKEKGDIQGCKNYRGIKLVTHTFNLWEKVVDRRMIEYTEIHESQFGCIPRRSTTDAVFANTRETSGRPEGYKVTFIDLQKAYDQVRREEIWIYMRERNVPEQNVRLMQDII